MKYCKSTRNKTYIGGLQFINKDSKSEMPANKLADSFNTDKLAGLLNSSS